MKNLWLVLAALLVFAATVMAEREAISTGLEEGYWWRPGRYSWISGSTQVHISSERQEAETIKASISDILALGRKEVALQREEAETVKEASIADILALGHKEVLAAGHQRQEES